MHVRFQFGHVKTCSTGSWPQALDVRILWSAELRRTSMGISQHGTSLVELETARRCSEELKDKYVLALPQAQILARCYILCCFRLMLNTESCWELLRGSTGRQDPSLPRGYVGIQPHQQDSWAVACDHMLAPVEEEPTSWNLETRCMMRLSFVSGRFKWGVVMFQRSVCVLILFQSQDGQVASSGSWERSIRSMIGRRVPGCCFRSRLLAPTCFSP